MYLWLLSWVSAGLYVLLATLCLACGLYYLAELVEEYTVMTRKGIQITIMAVGIIQIGFLVFERVPLWITGLGLVALVLYTTLLDKFPYFDFVSPQFLGSAAIAILHHYFVFRYFGEVWYPFSEVVAYFTICVWLVPFLYFLSLSANENTLPTAVISTQDLGSSGSGMVSGGFGKGGSKRQGLLSIFQWIGRQKESMLPSRGLKREV
eukprot:Clim_evm22s142 gene=Clim_evmTU22s142